MILTGCGFDPTGISTDDFEINVFTVSLKNIRNPISLTDVQITIEIFAGIQEGQAILKIAELNEATISTSQFTLASGEVSMLIQKPIAGESSSYRISFTPEIELNPSSGCFLKYTFPVEIDPREIILNEIQDNFGSSPDTSQVKHNFGSGVSPYWIAIPGCQFDPTDKTEDELESIT